ncbi:helix-turn-helix domain-containing protein [Oceanobacillus neutriphilus]|uniref:HTH cro/C1-type domain-containing protein n=1 Tax=Oceanobacillus neutriphilus TaxID=531815 RepID=A0ABQ2P3F3_9BACI|nr:helix-turn-helix transcriptional regulator [Oceanobacillus neutriphilus]GGP17194.1 hypothetical protein GCM10011346_52150 [Oceanobacillus neutriphilus]
MNESILPKRLRELREKNGYLQKYVADKLGVKSNTLSGYENGTRNPDPEIIKDLAKLYNVSTDYLLGHETEENKYEYFKNKIVTEFPNIDLMFHDMESLTGDDLEEVYEFIKFKKSQKK